MIVVDSSVLIDLFKGVENAPVDRLRALEDERIPFAIPTVCAQEVLQGARNEREWKLLAEYLTTQWLLSPTDAWESHLDAARIYFDCRRRGLTIRSSTDCLIAQLVLEREGILLHNDTDFERIAKVRPLRTLTE